MQSAETLEAPPQRTETSGDPAVTGSTLTRTLLLLHMVVLVLVRLLRDADDFANWDLTGFLNANSFSSLQELLARPEVHFRNPFSFPQYNVGAESAISAVLFRLLAHVSFYWSTVIVLLVYDALFLLLLHLLFRELYHGVLGESLAWLLLAMSPVILTFMSTSAFNMQGYCVIVLGLLSTEHFLQQRPILGLILLAAAFCTISQGYPLAFYMPYFVAVWSAYRTIGQPPPGVPARQRAMRAVVNLTALAGFVYFVSRISKGIYLLKIAPVDPYGSTEPALPRLTRTVTLFIRQSFLPVQRVDGVPVGFAPYFIYVVLILASLSALLVLIRQRRLPRPSGGMGRGLVRTVFALGLVIFGYLPAFISVIVKSQRAFFGDLFLVIVTVFSLLWVLESRIRRGAVWVLLAGLLCTSDAYYLYFTLTVDHAQNHWPRFDFDLSDGVARHDLVAVIGPMKQEVEHEDAALIVHYPWSLAENTTDPAMFFARFLRHFGPYQNRPELMFPCRWCRVKGCPSCGIRYGCPFPEVVNLPCGEECCYTDSVEEIARRGLTGRKLVLWWHETPNSAFRLESTLQNFAERYRVHNVPLPAVATEWRAVELVPLPPEGDPTAH